MDTTKQSAHLPESPQELDQGLAALERLILDSPPDRNWNEADTRLHFIDDLLRNCLGWPKSWFSLEKHAHEGFADYVLGQPGLLVVEAKRAGNFFEIPVSTRSSPIRSIQSLIKTSDGLRSAIEQVIPYCAQFGVEYGAVCNGNQLVVFIALRPGKPPLEGRALVIESLADYKKHFATLWQNLSPEAVRQRRLTRTLTVGAEAAVPQKLSASIFGYKQFRYKNNLQEDLRALADLLINDIPESEDIKAQFYIDCYCSTGQLNRYSVLSERIMKDRYAALFDSSESAPAVSQIDSNDLIAGSVSKAITVEALAKRPIVLLGDTGVGKTSFLTNLILRKAKDTFKNALYLVIDLGRSGALTYKIRDFVIEQIEKQLYEKYSADINERTFVRTIYDLEAKRFKRSIFSPKDGEPAGVNEYLQNLARNKPEHLRRAVGHLSRGKKKQVVIVIDNADQRDFDDQQEAFLAAQEIAASWNSLVYVSVRPETFYVSKQRGALSAYANRVFTILPPTPDEALLKRLVFALRIADGHVHPETLKQITLNLESITTVLRVLIRSIKSNADIRKFIASITGGDMRKLIELFTMFIGSPNVDFKNILEIEGRQGDYIIPLHEFSKHALLGEYTYFSPTTSLAENLFDVSMNDPREHFLAPMMLSFLNSPGGHRDKDGFTVTARIQKEMQSLQFLPQQIAAQLKRLSGKKLIEASGRAAEVSRRQRDDDAPLPDAFRLTSIGAYHLMGWLHTFAYLDAMSFDTPLFSDAAWDEMARDSASLEIEIRLRRATAFKKYLTEQWHASGLNATYFDWATVERNSEESFMQVKKALERRARYSQGKAKQRAKTKRPVRRQRR